jgi:hypothetical protein
MRLEWGAFHSSRTWSGKQRNIHRRKPLPSNVTENTGLQSVITICEKVSRKSDNQSKTYLSSLYHVTICFARSYLLICYRVLSSSDEQAKQVLCPSMCTVQAVNISMIFKQLVPLSSYCCFVWSSLCIWVRSRVIQGGKLYPPLSLPFFIAG